MSIRVIIFDLGNVILTNDWHDSVPEKFDEFSKYFRISIGDMERGWAAAWPRFHKGKITEGKFWEVFLKVAGADKIDVEKAKNIWRKHQRSIENMLGLLRKLKRNYRLAAITTVSREWLDYKTERYSLDKYFQVIVSSGYSGLSKPDSKIFDLAVKRIKIKPDKCLFIDDSESNLIPARKIGMHTILFRGQRNLEKELLSLGIRF